MHDGEVPLHHVCGNPKTVMEGVTKVVTDVADHENVAHYIGTMTQAQIGSIGSSVDPNELFLLCGGHHMNKPFSRLKTIGKRYGLQLHNATWVRKIGATTVAIRCGLTPEV